jgi:protein SCO1/2
MKSIVLALAWISLLGASVASAANALPGDSVYQLDIALDAHDGSQQAFADRRGRPQLVTMFYSSCPMVCPMIIDSLRMTRQALDEDARKDLDVLAVSFDSERDDPATLRALAEKRKLGDGWTLAHVSAADARALAAVLGIQYRQLPDGEFSHSSELVLLDREGRIAARTGIIGKPDPEFIAAVREVVAAH